MASDGTEIIPVFLLLLWTFLSAVPDLRKHYNFTKILSSKDVVKLLLNSANLSFAPGLLDIISSSTPPTVDFFKSLPTEASKRWGIYLHVLEKQGCKTAIYIGSGTQVDLGVSTRLSQYKHGRKLPRYVAAYLDKGYEIVYTGLLCWMPIPGPADVPKYRILIVAAEATFTFLFWAIRCSTEYGFGLHHTCPWGSNNLEYDGLCSHSPLMEGVVSDFDLSPEELEAAAILHKLRRAIVRRRCVVKSRLTNPEFAIKKNARNKERRKNNPEAVKREIKAWKVRVIKEERNHCADCGLSFFTPKLLQVHCETPRHEARVARKNSSDLQKKKPHYCAACNIGFAKRGGLATHALSKRHIVRTEKLLQENAEMDDANADDLDMSDIDDDDLASIDMPWASSPSI